MTQKKHNWQVVQASGLHLSARGRQHTLKQKDACCGVGLRPTQSTCWPEANSTSGMTYQQAGSGAGLRPTPVGQRPTAHAGVLVLTVALLLCLPLHTFASSWNPTVLVNTESFQTIDEGNLATDVELRFGDSLNEKFYWDRVNQQFRLTDDLSVPGYLSGSTLRVDTAAEVQGTLTASGAVRFDDNLTLNDDADSNDVLLTFGSDTTNETMTWANTADQWEFSDDIAVRGAMSGYGLHVGVDGITSSGSVMIGNGSPLSLSVRGVMSGYSLRVSGPADIHGSLNASGATVLQSTLSGASTITFSNLKLCDTIDTDINGALVCGVDAGAGGGISQTDGDLRYVNGHGDTMTGNLIIESTSGATAVNLAVRGIMSGYTLSAGVGGINSSGSVVIGYNDTNTANLTVRGNMSGYSLRVSGPADIHGSLNASGATVLQSTVSGASTITFSNLKLCDTIDTNINGVLVCGTDDAGSGGGGFGTGNVLTIDETRYVNTHGDTMTGNLIIESTSGATAVNLAVRGIMSGYTLSAGIGGINSSGAVNIGYSGAQANLTVQGNILVNTTNASLVKTTTGTANSTDFSIAGSTLTNVTSASDMVSIDEGTVPASGQGTMATSSVVTSAAVGGGGQTIALGSGSYLIIHGNSLSTCSLWDGASATMTSITCATGATNPGAGAIALKRPDGRYLIIHANTSNLSTLFDPLNLTTVVAGPTANFCATAAIGTNAFLRDDGKYVVLCGGSTSWSVYDPTANTWAAGTAVSTNFGSGAQALKRDNGTFLVFAGGNVTSHWLYNPYASAVGTMTADPITSNAPTIGTGSFALRRADGKFLIMGGAINTSSIYDPTETSVNSGAGSMTAQSGVGSGPTVAISDGAQAVWRQDGKYLLVIGSGSTTTNIVDPSQSGSSQFTAGPALPRVAGSGTHLILRPDGKYQIIRGMGSTETYTYDMGYVMGGSGAGVQLASYETECMTATSLSQSGSRLFWTANQEGTMNFQVRTGNGSCSAPYKDILNNGDYIRPFSGDNRVQVKVFFKRPAPNFADQEWKLRRGVSQTVYRQTNSDPTLYDLTVDNSAMIHRTQFEFGNGIDPSGPIGVNIVNDRDKQLAISLAAGIGYGSTLNATNPQYYNGAFGSGTNLLTSASSGTLVLRRPDGKFIVIPGNLGTADAMIYNGDDQTFIDLGVNPTAGAGLGALAFKRPNGTFLIVMGGGIATTTNIYDPVANTFTAGPAVTAAPGRGAIAIPLPTGRVLILHGNFATTSSIYDPYQNTMVAGPITSAAVGDGSMAIPRPDGTYAVVLGMSGLCTPTTTMNNFDPYTMTFTATGMPTISTGTGPGAHAFQRTDGQWVIVHGGGTTATCAASNRTQIYNPYTNQALVGPTLTGGSAGSGAFALPRPDGSWIVVHGGPAKTTSIFLEKSGLFTTGGLNMIGTFVAGPDIVTTSTGSVAFQRDDGKFMIVSGQNALKTQLYDAGWVAKGIYKSEQMNVADLDSTSTLTWRATPDMSGISTEVKTATSQLGLQTAAARDIPYSGAPISPSASETWVRVHFNFKRTFPSYGGIFTDVWYNGGGNVFPLRPIATPTVTEYRIGKDTNLLNLQANARPVFRVSSNGDIYTGPQSAILTGGADLAERYSSSQDLAGGDVVAIDPGNDNGVIRSAAPYENDVLGVVSSNPGVVAGAYAEHSYPIALMGRVPVKVTTENGAVHTGDRLAASSIAGHAMKALQASRVLGMALASTDPEHLRPCTDKTLAARGVQCGTVMMFVDLSDWPGPRE